MLPYLRSEIYRLRRRRMTFVLLLLMALIAVALYTLLYTSAQAQLQLIRSGQLQAQPGQPPVTEEAVKELLEMLRPDRVPSFGLGIVGALGTILAIILSGSVVGNEFGWATIRTVLAHGGRRAYFLFAKLVALAGATAAIVVAGFAASFVASYAVSIPAGLDLAFGPDIVGRTLGNMLRSLYVALPYIAFATLMAVVARSAASGIAFGLVLSFGESLVAQLVISLNRDLRQLFDAGLARNVSTITRTQQTVASGTGTVDPPQIGGDLWIAVLILALYTIAFVALAVHKLATRDVTLA